MIERSRCATDGRHRSVKSSESAVEMRGFVVPARDLVYFLFKEHRQLWYSIVNSCRWIPRAGSLKLCYVRRFLTMTDERAIMKIGLKTCAGSSHGHGKSPFMTL